MSHIPSYPKVWNMGHPAIAELLYDPVTVEEKVDGSQFSFMVAPNMLDPAVDSAGELLMRSKGAEVFPQTSDKLFRPAVETVTRLAEDGLLHPGYIYRGEVLAKPKHNALAYDRVPAGNIIIFDIERSPGEFLPPPERRAEAARLGLEAVPVMKWGLIEDADSLLALLDTDSVLGGQKVEGVVIKNHARWGKDGKFLAGKHVSERFREVHSSEWRKSNPNKGDIVDNIVASLRTPARWDKAVQHLRERGELKGTPQDIGPLIQEVQQDILAECEEDIKEALMSYAWPKVRRGVTGGLPEYYKDLLLQAQFEGLSDEPGDLNRQFLREAL